MSEIFVKKKSQHKRLVSQAPLHGTFPPPPFSTENLVHKEKRGNSWNKKNIVCQIKSDLIKSNIPHVPPAHFI